MRPSRLAPLLAGIALVAMLVERGPVGNLGREWLALASPHRPWETITIIQTPAPAGAMDAALALRAVLRHAPKGFVFLDPMTNREGLPLLLSKLGDAAPPVVFSANDNLSPLPAVTVSPNLPALPAANGIAPPGAALGFANGATLGRQADHAVASSALRLVLAVDRISDASVLGATPGVIRAGRLIIPTDAAGRSHANPRAVRLVERIDFERLMIRAERSESGDIIVDLDNLFRGRIVAVESAGGTGGILLAALHNGLTESPAPLGVMLAAILLMASLPWWPFGRGHRALAAAGAGCLWLLFALGMYQDMRVTVPLVPALLLPLLAWIPPRLK